MKERKNLYLSMVGWGLLLAGALSFSSCVDDELDNGLQTTGKNIGFNASYSRGTWEPDQTRSAKEKQSSIRCESSDGDFSVDVTVEDGIRSFQSEQVESRGTQIAQKGGWNYRVGAYYTTDKEATNLDSKTINFFTENTDGGISIASDADNFTTNYYWPPVGTMKFFAVAPADVTGLSIPSVNDINTPTITYTIPENVADQKDIMVAQTTADCPQNTAVGLQFQHLLAAVQFKVGAMQFIKINSIKITGIKGGAITMAYDNQEGSWTYSSKTEAIYSPEPMEVAALAPSGTPITGNENKSMMLVMPQTLGENALVTISYKNQLTGEEITNVSAPLKGNWEAGKTTVYSFNIGTIFDVEIPEPLDQDAHYVRLDMTYDLGNLGDKISSIKARAFFLDDGSNTSSKSNITLKNTELSPTQEAGYWTDEQWILEYSVNDRGEKNPENPVAVKQEGKINGTPEISITQNSGIIYLFLEENNGYTDRNGELVFTAHIDETDTDIVLGKQSFKQLCPRWNGTVSGQSVGIERFEEKDSYYPYGFNYNRTVTYSNPGLTDYWISKELRCLINGYFLNINETKNGFITFEKVNGKIFNIFSVTYIKSITFNYNALNVVESVADSNDGLENTRALYNFTGNTDLNSAEKEISNSWKEEDSTTADDVPEDYAAYIALSRNRMYELKTIIHSNENLPPTYKAVLHKDNQGSDIIEWYLPSSNEAKTLITNESIEVGTETDLLNGEYWSSSASSDVSGYACSFKYKDNELDKTYGTDGINANKPRMDELKVRAVRKKP